MLRSGFMYQESGPKKPFLSSAIDGQHEGRRPESARRIRHAERRDAAALFRMMARERPDHRRAPVVPDPDRLLAPEVRKQLEHVRDALLQRVVLVAAMHRRAP